MRLLYDSEMPLDMLKYLVHKMGLHAESLDPGQPVPQFQKLYLAFPNVGRKPSLEYERTMPLSVAGLVVRQKLNRYGG